MLGINTTFNISMKSGIRPVKSHLDILMFCGIVMDVIHIRPVFILTADLMFPESPLSDSRLSVVELQIIHPFFNLE